MEFHVRVCRDPHLYISVEFTGLPSIATRLTLNGQSVHSAGVTPGCCWVRVVQAASGAPVDSEKASLKHTAARTRRAAQRDIIERAAISWNVLFLYFTFLLRMLR